MEALVPYVDPDWLHHRVRVLRNGKVVCVVDIEQYEAALAWGYGEMRVRAFDDEALWAAVVEAGVLFVDPVGTAPPLFIGNGTRREGLVLDLAILKDHDYHEIFGISLPRK